VRGGRASGMSVVKYANAEKCKRDLPWRVKRGIPRRSSLLKYAARDFSYYRLQRREGRQVGGEGGGGGAFIAALAIMPVCYRGDAYPFGNARVVTKGKKGRGKKRSSFISVFLPLGARGRRVLAEASELPSELRDEFLRDAASNRLQLLASVRTGTQPLSII